LIGAAALAAVCAWANAAMSQDSLEYPVKAAFLPKFGGFLEWPPHALGDGAVNLCIFGHDPFGSALDRASQSVRIGPRPIVVRRLPELAGWSSCHLMYVGRGRRPVGEVLRAVQGYPVVTITDEAVGPARGVIHFVVRDNRVRFHIDDRQAARGNVGISSKLLNLALSVRAR
jgi:hypothetical protein